MCAQSRHRIVRWTRVETEGRAVWLRESFLNKRPCLNSFIVTGQRGWTRRSFLRPTLGLSSDGDGIIMWKYRPRFQKTASLSCSEEESVCIKKTSTSAVSTVWGNVICKLKYKQNPTSWEKLLLPWNMFLEASSYESSAKCWYRKKLTTFNTVCYTKGQAQDIFKISWGKKKLWNEKTQKFIIKYKTWSHNRQKFLLNVMP